MFQIKKLQPALPKLPVADAIFKRCFRLKQLVPSNCNLIGTLYVGTQTCAISLMKQVTS